MVVRPKSVAAKKAPVGKAVATAPDVAATSAGEAVASEALAAPKQKLVRDSFTMPRPEYDAIAALKSRLVKLERPTKKGELLRAGIAALASMPDAKLMLAVERIPSLKTGRPKKAKNRSTG